MATVIQCGGENTALGFFPVNSVLIPEATSVLIPYQHRGTVPVLELNGILVFGFSHCVILWLERVHNPTSLKTV